MNGTAPTSSDELYVISDGRLLGTQHMSNSSPLSCLCLLSTTLFIFLTARGWAGVRAIHIGIAGRPSDRSNIEGRAFCNASACLENNCWSNSSFQCSQGYFARPLNRSRLDSFNISYEKFQCCTENLSHPLYCDASKCRSVDGKGGFSCWASKEDKLACADGYALTKTGHEDDDGREEYQCCTPQTDPCNNATLLDFDWYEDEILSTVVPAMNVSNQDWCAADWVASRPAADLSSTCEDDPMGYVAADPYFDCAEVDVQGGGVPCDHLDPDFNGVQNIYIWQLCPKSCNRCSGTRALKDAPSARVLWTVNGRVMYRKCGESRQGKLEMVLGGSMHDPMAEELAYIFDMCPPDLFAKCTGTINCQLIVPPLGCFLDLCLAL